VQPEPRAQLQPLNVTQEEFAMAIPDDCKGASTFLKSAGRLYLDFGNHPEAATAEADSLRELKACEYAYEDVLLETADNLARSKGWHRIVLNKRVLEHGGLSWGAHENYSVPRAMLMDNDWQLPLGLHLLSRSIITGSGTLVKDNHEPGSPRDGSFSLAQKVLALTCDVARNTSAKPLINIRDEPHALESKYGRLHVVCGDALLSPWSLEMQFGMGGLVTDAIRHGFKAREFAPRLPKFVIAKQVALDVDMRRTYELEGGGSITARGWQYEMLKAARLASEREDLGDEKRAVIDEWQVALDALADGVLALRDRADHGARLHLLQHHREKHGYEPGDNRAFARDRQFDEMSGKGIAYALRKKAWSRLMPPPKLVEARRTEPVPTTRAAVRSQVIGLWPDKQWHYRLPMNWVGMGTPGGGLIEALDPFSPNNWQLDRLLESRAKEAA
jgi:proteasome accessory factor A